HLDPHSSPTRRSSDLKGSVLTYAIGIGTDESPTPLTQTRVRAKISNPAWYPPQSIRKQYEAAGEFLPAVVPPGPDNPMGPLKIRSEEHTSELQSRENL